MACRFQTNLRKMSYLRLLPLTSVLLIHIILIQSKRLNDGD